MKDLAIAIIRGLADHPDRVSIQESESEGSVLLKLSVAEEDKGKVIGKQGKVIKAVRTVLASVAGKNNKRVSLDLD